MSFLSLELCALGSSIRCVTNPSASSARRALLLRVCPAVLDPTVSYAFTPAGVEAKIRSCLLMMLGSDAMLGTALSTEAC